jgi:hypothetical protein
VWTLRRGDGERALRERSGLARSLPLGARPERSTTISDGCLKSGLELPKLAKFHLEAEQRMLSFSKISFTGLLKYCKPRVRALVSESWSVSITALEQCGFLERQLIYIEPDSVGASIARSRGTRYKKSGMR